MSTSGPIQGLAQGKLGRGWRLVGELKDQAVALCTPVRNSLNSSRSCSPPVLLRLIGDSPQENSCLSVKAQFQHCLLQETFPDTYSLVGGPFFGIPSVTFIMEFITPVCLCHPHYTDPQWWGLGLTPTCDPSLTQDIWK